MGRTAAFVMVALLFAADQASKLWVLAQDPASLPRRVAPFLDITLVWNRGISYGMLQTDGAGRWLLAAFTAAAAVGLAVWLWRTPHRLTRLAVALILSGALGNLVDRVVYGAVVDFVHLHAGDFSWYVFNVADAAIVIGAAVLVADMVFGGRHKAAQTRP